MADTNNLPIWLPQDPAATVDIPRLPYAERQTVVVVPVHEATQTRRALRAAAEGDADAVNDLVRSDRGVELEAWVGLALAAAVRFGVLGSPMARALEEILPRAAKHAAAAFKAWRNSGISILVISTAEQDLLRWPKGDPVRNQIYAGSPADPRTYYPLASFHDDVFFERAQELRSVIRRLGAASMRARHTRIQAQDAKAHGRLAIKAKVTGGLRGEKSRFREREEVFNVTMAPAPPREREEVIADLAWLDREREWKELIEERYRDRLRKETLVFRDTTDYGLGAVLEAALRDLPAEVNLGGNFSRHEGSTYEIEATFEPFAAAPTHFPDGPTRDTV